MKKDIFISYSSKDNSFVKKLAKDLTSKNIKVWLDKLEINPADNIVKSIGEGLSSSKYLLVIISPESIKNPNWITEEWSTKYYQEVNKRTLC